MLRRSFFKQFCLLTLSCLAIGCGSGEQPTATNGSASIAPVTGAKRIVILTNGTAPYWDAAVAGANDAARDFKCDQAGLSVTIDRGDFKVETQINKLRQFASASDVVALGVSVMDAKSQSILDELKKLQEAGVKILTIDSDVDRETSSAVRFAYLGTDNTTAGNQLGKAAKGLMESATYAAFVGDKGAANATERIGGFRAAAGETFKESDFFADAPDGATKARANVRDALDRNKDVNLLVGIWSYNTPAIVDIVSDLKLRDKVKIIGFDADPPAITGMKDGMVDVMVIQNPYQMGYQGVRILKALIEKDEATVKEMLPNHGQPGGDIYDTGLKVVVPDEGSPLKAELFDKNTQFLKLSEFQEWLSKNKLTGS